MGEKLKPSKSLAATLRVGQLFSSPNEEQNRSDSDDRPLLLPTTQMPPSPSSSTPRLSYSCRHQDKTPPWTYTAPVIEKQQMQMQQMQSVKWLETADR